MWPRRYKRRVGGLLPRRLCKGREPLALQFLLAAGLEGGCDGWSYSSHLESQDDLEDGGHMLRMAEQRDSLGL